MQRIKPILRIIKRILKATFGIVLFVFLVQRSTYPTYLDWNAIAMSVAEYKFDYVTWEVEALWAKTTHALFGQTPFMDEAARSDLVRAYMADMARVRQIEAELDRLFLTGEQDSALETERDALRDSLSKRQTSAESILEGQVAAVLVDEGFGLGGQLLPPVSMRFTQMPTLLVVSPRDEISRKVELALDYLSAQERSLVERRVESVRDVSALVVPLGGMAIYPAMIQESGDLAWTVETFAHEWVHHYFFFFPLGLNYFVETGGNAEALIINETVADIFGAEIAQEVLTRYYPELMTDAPERTVFAKQSADPFDYGATMNETRVNVDQLMGRIERLQTDGERLTSLTDAVQLAKLDRQVQALIRKAEAYMEHRRLIFVANGYNIRRMNQAFFAFYGGYQGGIPGIGGEDPIGPTVRQIRAASADVHEFIVTMRGITSRDELLKAGMSAG